MKTDSEKLNDLMQEATKQWMDDGRTDFYIDFAADYLISNGATIPVRCGECIHHGKYTATGNIYCKHPKGLTEHKEDCFCSYGERKEE